MREHQIVITLKPEQFVQVQKLAKNAGAKSMGMFVRQQLLAALGIEGTMESAPQIDLEPALADLRRLHGELKGFVAESLASFKTDMLVDTASAEGNPAADDLMAALAPLLDDELEKTAQQTFAISPRLGAMELDAVAEHESIRAVSDEKPEPEEQEQQAQAEPIVKQGSEFSFKTPWMMPAKNNYNFFNAISTQEDNEAKPDPLSELLGDDAGLEAQAHQSDEDSFDVPLSILARRQQLEAQKRAIEFSSGQNPNSTSPEKPAASVPPAKPLSQNSESLSQNRPKTPESTAQPAPAQGSQPSTEANPLLRPLDNPEEDPPFSGGPPPKRQ